jgi:hypothetical protein
MEKYIGKPYARNYRGTGPRSLCRNLRGIQTRMKRTLRFLALIVVGLAIGAVSGVVHGRRSLGQGSEVLSQSFALAEYETLASLEYKEADPTHAKQALLDLLAFMDQMEAANRVAIQKSLDLDRGITYMRLAMLEERAGNNDLARGYVGRAQMSFKKRDNSDISEDRLRELTLKFDSTSHYELPAVSLLKKAIMTQ